MRRFTGKTNFGPDSRRGSVLLAVLAVIAMLSFAAWAFCDAMVSENIATSAHARQIERRLIVDSGIAWSQARLSLVNRKSRSATAEPQKFESLFSDSAESISANWKHVAVGDHGGFTVLHREVDANSLSAITGPYDLSGLININAVRALDATSDRETARGFLLALPNMSVDTADAILDFVADPANLNPRSGTITSRNDLRPLSNLKILLRVPGVSAEALFGEDINENGLLDRGEDVNEDGQLQYGWSQYLTVVNGVSNRRPDGTRKIHINQSSLAGLYDEVAARFGPQVAQYVVAFRLNGALSDLSDPTAGVTSAEARQRAALERGRLQRGEISRPTSTVTTAADQSRGGLDLSVGPVFVIESLVDLFGTSVRTLVEGQDSILQAPWSSDATTMFQRLPQLHAHLTVSGELITVGQVNVFVAPQTVLRAVPGITSQVADNILDARQRMAQPPTSIAWLLDQGIVTHPQLRRIAPLITAGGDYFRATIVADLTPRSTARPSYARSLSGSAITIDATWHVPRLVSHRELTAGECRAWWRMPRTPENKVRRMALSSHQY